jgi:hypothetical protein
MNKEAANFLAFVKKDCKEHNIKFNFINKRYVQIGKTKCNGFFDSETNVLAVAAGQPFDKWIRILAHEYSHMTQWIDNCKAWKEGSVGNRDSEQMISLWIERKVALSESQKNRYISRARALELDCERRTLKLIDTHKLPIDKVEYAKSANAYIYFWTYVGICRKWYTIGKEPYNTPAIVEIMPTHLYCNYDKIPSKVEELFKEIVA